MFIKMHRMCITTMKLLKSSKTDTAIKICTYVLMSNNPILISLKGDATDTPSEITNVISRPPKTEGQFKFN